MPDWVRARGMSIYQVALMGGAAAGSLLWGQVAAWLDVRGAVIAAAYGVPCTTFCERYDPAISFLGSEYVET